MAGGYKSFFAVWLGRAGAILSTGDTCRQAVASLMRNTAVAALGVMANSTVPSTGTMRNSLPVMAEMRNAVVAAHGAMSNSPAATSANLC